MSRTLVRIATLAGMAVAAVMAPAGAQPPSQYGGYGPPPPTFYPEQLDQLVSRIALYPDPLLAQVLTAATYSNEIPDAAGWANAHRYLTGDALAGAIQQDNLPWDPSIMALLPFPNVLDTMARDMGWTQQLGNAVLADRGAVMDAVQRMRQRAYDYGYLRDNQYDRVIYTPGAIQIMPVAPGYLYVPFYNPAVVFYRPARGVVIGGAITFGPRIFVGGGFAPFGWGNAGFGWREHTVIIDRRPWERTWVNRDRYVHPYYVRPPHYEGPRVERHEIHEYREDRGRGDRGREHERERH